MEGKIQNGVRPTRTDDAGAGGKRFIRVDAIYSQSDHQMHLFKTAQELDSPNDLRKYAFIVKRSVSSKGRAASPHVEINSQYLSRILQDVFPDAESTGAKLEVAAETLWHASPVLRQQLDQAKKSRTRDDAMISDIEAALEFVQEEYATTTSHFTALQQKRLISSDLLWCLFPPHVEVFTAANALNEPQVLRCKSSSYREDERTGEKWFEIKSECLNNVGQSFGWSEQLLKIPFFKGTANITSLPAYPLAYHSEAKNLCDRLRARGKIFLGLLTQPTCRKYGAMALIPRRGGIEWEQETFSVSGRVMVDPARYPKSGSSSDLIDKPSCPPPKIFSPEKTPEKDLIFCHYSIIGFSFDQKRWGALAISQLRDPEWDDKALDRVMMAPAKRELLRSLVSAQRAESNGHAVPNDSPKGRDGGLVGLLSGPPGVGKTLTAEAVAEASRRPLYVVSAGELGTEVSDVDRRLGKVLAVASSWRCMLLIEDCDLFVRQRDHVSVVNNALVSIFLRRLECFQGLAVLTTNKKENIDKALLSRLHFRFQYENLGAEQRLALWNSFLGSAKSLDKAKLGKIATEYAVNGHEIKNAVSCAKTIAQSRRITVTADVLKEALDEVCPRCDTIKETQGTSATFEEVSRLLLLAQSTLAAVQRAGQDLVISGNEGVKNLDNGDSMVAPFSDCNEKGEEPTKTLRKARDPHEDARPSQKLYSANVKRLGGTTSREEEALMQRIRDNNLSFGANQVLRLSTQDQVDKFSQAVQGLNLMKPTTEEKKLEGGITLVYSGSGNLNIQLGNGDMFDVNKGGVVNKAERMSVAPAPIPPAR